MRVLSAPRRVLAVEFENRRELTLTMCRMEEFYESPHKLIRGNSFTWEQFLNAYMDEAGTLDYFSKWEGFNVPRRSLDLFKRLFVPTNREAELLNRFYEGKFEYLIAVDVNSDPTVLPHELSHALFEMDNAYAHTAVDKISDSGLFEEMSRHLLAAEYPDQTFVLLSEVNAYLATSAENELEEMFPGMRMPYHPLRRELVALWEKASVDNASCTAV